ncbi:hypothetical protein HJC23_001300 [Cyclotella cryptica]|uniref:Uncharacterized protein n=1 Tax=Cyclotella cryptica TaxID=29204 RepID=A0ABD3PAN7_9STRA|eukprot:CCRYP_016549-RA/>CCRYP_016549-RA protein AED:0.00 eAED:0.00 QI:363/1/1/1/0/0/2/1480/85
MSSNMASWGQVMTSHLKHHEIVPSTDPTQQGAAETILLHDAAAAFLWPTHQYLIHCIPMIVCLQGYQAGASVRGVRWQVHALADL